MLKDIFYMVLFLAVVLMFYGCSKKADKIDIVAHRGSSFIAPENTKAAIELAWQQDSPAAECDVYLTKDKKIMLMHDKTVKRTGGVDIKMADANSQMLSKIDIGSWKGPEYKGECVPFLSEVMETIPAGRKLFIEIKTGPEILPFIVEDIKAYGKNDRLAIIAFNFDVITGCKRLMPDIPAYWLIASKKDKETKQRLPYNTDYIAKAKAAGLDGLDVYYKGLTKEFVTAVKAEGMGLYVWTVDDLADVKSMQEMAVSGITTNKPDVLLEYFNNN